MTRPQPRSTLFPYTTLFRSAATASKSSEIQISVLRVRSVKLASNDGSATYSRVGAGPSHRIRDRLLNRYWLASGSLGCSLCNKGIRYLVHVSLELRQMHAVRSGISYVGEEPSRELTLDVEIPLLHITVFGIQVRCEAN